MADNFDGSVEIEINLSYEKFKSQAQDAERQAGATGKAIEESLNPDTSGLDEIVFKMGAIPKQFLGIDQALARIKESQKELSQLYKSDGVGEEEYRALNEQLTQTQENLKNYSKEFDLATKEYDKNTQKVKDLTRAQEDLDVSIESIVANTYDMYSVFSKDAKAMEELVGGALNANKEFQKLAKESERLNESIEEHTKKTDEALNAQYRYTQQVYSASRASHEASKTIADAAKVEREYAESANLLNAKITERESYLSRLNSHYKANTDSVWALERAETTIRQLITLHKEQLAELTEEIKRNTKEHGANSEQVLKLRTEYNKTHTSINQYREKLREAQGETDKNTNSVSTFQIALGNLVAKGLELAIRALKDFVKAGVEYNVTLATANEVIGIVFGPTGQQIINEWASTVGKQMGFAEGTAKQYAQSLGLIFQEARKTNTQIAEMSTKVLEVSRDWSSFIGASPEDVLDAVESALQGNVRALRDYGINLTAADLNNEKYRKGIKGTWAELDAGEKALVVYNALLDKTSQATGHALDNQDSYNNALFNLQQTVKRVAGDITKNIVPALAKSFQKVSDYLDENEEALQNLGAIVENVVNLFLQLLKVLAGVPPEFIMIIAYLALAVKAFTSIFDTVGKVTGAFTKFGGQTDRTIAKVIALIGAISILVFLLLSLKEGSESASKAIQGMGEASKNAQSQAQQATRRAPQYASGTEYAQRGWAVVGENGPELIRMSGGEQVLNSTRTASLIRSGIGVGSSSTVNHSTYIDARKITVRTMERVDPVVDEFYRRQVNSRAHGGS